MRSIPSTTDERDLKIAKISVPVPAPHKPLARPNGSLHFARVRIILLFLGFGFALAVAFLLFFMLSSSSSAFFLAETKGQLSALLDIGVLVFREGLECVLVLAALTAGMRGVNQNLRQPISLGVIFAAFATILTWVIAVRILDSLGDNFSALAVQAGTGLLAILVLLVVMNWFFHKLYWTGWISLHTEKSRKLLDRQNAPGNRPRVIAGMLLLGFTSFYREGFEVVLFLQSYRLRLPSAVLFLGVLSGALASGIVAILTFAVHRRLPYRRMLVWTGLLLAVVLLVMVGEEAQEMQLAHWLPATKIPWLTPWMPSWLGIWLSVFPTVETLSAQALAGILVFGSYFTAQSFQRSR